MVGLGPGWDVRISALRSWDVTCGHIHRYLQGMMGVTWDNVPDPPRCPSLGVAVCISDLDIYLCASLGRFARHGEEELHSCRRVLSRSGRV